MLTVGLPRPPLLTLYKFKGYSRRLAVIKDACSYAKDAGYGRLFPVYSCLRWQWDFLLGRVPCAVSMAFDLDKKYA